MEIISLYEFFVNIVNFCIPVLTLIKLITDLITFLQNQKERKVSKKRHRKQKKASKSRRTRHF